MVYMHFGPGMTLRALVPAAGTACGDVVLNVPRHPVSAEAVLKPGLGPVYPLVSRCLDVMAQPELQGTMHQKPFLPPPFLRRTLWTSKRNRFWLME